MGFIKWVFILACKFVLWTFLVMVFQDDETGRLIMKLIAWVVLCFTPFLLLERTTEYIEHLEDTGTRIGLEKVRQVVWVEKIEDTSSFWERLRYAGGHAFWCCYILFLLWGTEK